MTRRKKASRKASRKVTKKVVKITGKTPPLAWLRYRGRGIYDYSNDRLVPMNRPSVRRRRAKDVARAKDFKVNRDMPIIFDEYGRATTAEIVLRSIIQVNADLVKHDQVMATLAGTGKRVSMLSIHGKKGVGNFIDRLLAMNIADITWRDMENGLRVTPIDRGCPDLVPIRFAKAFEAGETPDDQGYWTHFEDGGIEIKTTCGTLKPKTSKILQAAFPNGEITYDATKIEFLGSVTWSAHHPDSTRLLTFLWDNISGTPQIVAAFYADDLKPADYCRSRSARAAAKRASSGKKAHPTNATSLNRRGKDKLRFVAVLNDSRYTEKLRQPSFLPKSGI